MGISMPRPAKVTGASKATRDKIIKAASHAFARHGYEGAGIRAIVAEADVNQAAINYHFGSKDDPPPLKWSDLRYVFDIQEDCNGKEAIQA
jgi:AcrR family transcriptional regulator